MTIDQLRHFILIHRLGSINRASEQAHMSQQALNKSMKNLEEEVGCALLTPHARGVSLTEKGLLLEKTAEELLSKLDETLLQLQDTPPQTKDVNEALTIYFSPVTGQALISHVTKTFSQAHPRVQLALLEEESEAITRMILEEDAAALGILASFDALVPHGDHHTCLPIFDDKLYTVMAPSHPLAKQKSVSIRSLLKHPLTIYQSNVTFNNPIRALLESFGTPHYHVITNNSQLYQDAILHQGCVGFINGAALTKHTALRNILNDVVMLPVTHVPPIGFFAIIENSYLETHRSAITDFLNIYRSLC